MNLNNVVSSTSVWFDLFSSFMALTALAGSVVGAAMLLSFLIGNNRSSSKSERQAPSRHGSKSGSAGSGRSSPCKGGSNRGSWFDSSDSGGSCGGGGSDGGGSCGGGGGGD